MTLIDVLFLGISFVVGLGLGWVSYRYYLKRNPARIEELAAKWRDAKEAAVRRFE